MEKISNTFQSFSSIMEQNSRGVQIGCYSVALAGLAVAVRNVRPLSKFKKPSDIPNHFIEERRELIGIVERIEPNGALLMIRHKPLIDIPFVRSGQLPVKISGINVSGLGFNWLQTVLPHEKVKFIPVTKDKDFVKCQVLLISKTKNEKECFVNVGEKLVKIGFAVPAPIEKPLSEDNVYLRYYYLLLKAEKYAQYKQLGLKYYIKPTKKVLTQLYVLSSKYFQKAMNKVPKIYAS